MDTKYSKVEISEEQIKKFKEQEAEANNHLTYRKLAINVFKAGDKEWANHLFKKAENFAKNSSDCIILGKLVKDDKYLGNNEWAKKLFKKAENYCRIAQKELPNKDLSKRSTIRKILLEIENYGKLSENVDDSEWAERLKKELEFFVLELKQLQEEKESRFWQRIKNRKNK